MRFFGRKHNPETGGDANDNNADQTGARRRGRLIVYGSGEVTTGDGTNVEINRTYGPGGKPTDSSFEATDASGNPLPTIEVDERSVFVVDGTGEAGIIKGAGMVLGGFDEIPEEGLHTTEFMSMDPAHQAAYLRLAAEEAARRGESTE